ncbi:MAG: carbohydrate ABC transporter permease [Christensenellales bacterium]
MKNNRKLLVYIPAALLTVITVYPMLWTLAASFSLKTQLGRASIIPAGFTLKNYQELFVKENFLLYIGNTFIYAIAATSLQLLFNSMAGYSLSRLNYPGRSAMLMVFLSTLMVPFSVILIPLYLLISRMGVTNSYWALILPSMASGYGVFMLRQFYMSIPKDLEDAGYIDGLSYFGVYTHIVVPLSKPIMLALGLFAFIGCWNNLLWPLIINTNKAYWTITVGLKSFQDNRSTDWNAVLTGAAVSMMPIALLFISFQKSLVEGIKLSGMKL